jgi:hypothetical protein
MYRYWFNVDLYEDGTFRPKGTKFFKGTTISLIKKQFSITLIQLLFWI